MTKQLALILALLGVLAACSDGSGKNPVWNNTSGEESTDDETDESVDPVDPEDPENPVTEEGIPTSLAINVTKVSYSQGTNAASDADDTLQVELSALDQDPKVATYLRNAALDVPGFKAFSVQDDPLDRMFVAVAKQHTDGNVMAVAVADGGQFRKFFSGSYYKRNGKYKHPTTGLVSFAGRYAGVTNLNAPGQPQRLALPAGTDPTLVPYQPRQTKGKVFVNVDFDDNAVNGAIYDRSFANGEKLSDVNLVDGVMDKNGEFLGTTEFIQTLDEDGNFVTTDAEGSGGFGGIVGTDAKAVAGVVALDGVYHSTDVRKPEDGLDREVGAFVLPRCGTSGAPSICNDVKDFKK